jgi:WS/DGAT/MGAT family acyltransferase
MSRVDTAWLRMEQPSNLMMITGVIVFDDPLDYSALLDTVERRFLVFPRFRQRAIDGSAGARWELDPDFDLRAHVRRVALPGAADRAELEYLVEDLASTPLDHGRPLWQFHLVENYQDGPALVVRIHHCIADGIALVQVFLSLTDPTRNPRPSAQDPEKWQQKRSAESAVFQRLLEPAAEGLEFLTGMGQKLVQETMDLLQDPAKAYQYVGEAQDVLAELAHALTLSNDPPTSFKGRLGPRKRAAWTDPLPLAEIKAVARAFGCTVNDVLIATVSGALRRYFINGGAEEAELVDIRATVPVNLRPLEHALELGNHFGLVFLELPISEHNPLRRLYLVNERMNELKESKQAAVTFGFLAALGLTPPGVQRPVLDLLSEKASMVLTNVPGPQEPLYLAGSRLREMMFWVPQNGGIGVGVSILSYDGQVFFGVICDRNLVPEPREIIERFRQEFENLLYLGLMLPPDGDALDGQAVGLLEGREEEAGEAG